VSFWYGKPRPSSTDTFAGGVASLGDIFSAAHDQMLYVDNSFSSAAAMEQAIDERNAEVFSATGVKLDNPYRRDFRASIQEAAMQEQRRFDGRVRAEDPAKIIAQGIERWKADVATAAARIPDGNVGERLNRSIDGDAIRIARNADETLAARMESRPGLGKWAATFAGALSGSLRDPVQVGTLFIGGGVGAGRTVAARVLSTATREALVNGAAEAALQPLVQGWREKAGLPHGAVEAARNIALAAGLGGLVGAGGRAVVESVGKLSGRPLAASGEALAADPRVPEPLRRAMGGDAGEAASALADVRPALPPAARGALDHVEVLDHAEKLRPVAAGLEAHDAAIGAASRIVEDLPDAVPRFEIDARQVTRIADEIFAPSLSSSQGSSLTGTPLSITEFLIGRGGVLDDRGELKHIGAEKLTRKPKQRGVPDRRVPLDMAREAAEEAGYIGRADDYQTTTVADLLEAIDADLRGNRVYSREDGAHVDQISAHEAERGRVEATVRELAEIAGPAVDDALLRQAAELALREGMDAGDALERVFMQADAAPIELGRAGEAMPGWSDAELEAASARRGDEPYADPQSPFDDPATIDEEWQINLRDMGEVPDFDIPGDDGPVSLAAMMDDIANDGELAATVRACRA